MPRKYHDITNDQLNYIGKVSRLLRRKHLDFFDLVLLMAHQELQYREVFKKKCNVCDSWKLVDSFDFCPSCGNKLKGKS